MPSRAQSARTSAVRAPNVRSSSSRLRQRVAAVRVDAAGDHHQLGRVALDGRQHLVAEPRQVGVVAGAGRERHVQVGADARPRAGLGGVAGVGPVRRLVQRHRQHGRVLVEDGLRCRCRGARPSRSPRPGRRRARCCACRTAIAPFANRQKPIGRSRSAWWPGGRIAAIPTPAADRLGHGRDRARRPRAAPPRPSRPHDVGVGIEHALARRRGEDPLGVARRRARARGRRSSAAGASALRRPRRRDPPGTRRRARVARGGRRCRARPARGA